MAVPVLDPADAFRRLVAWQGLARPVAARGDAGVRAVLDELRCIQLDPLDRIGTNAELVAAARVDGLRRHQVYDALLPGHAFEHFAKERCLVPAALLPAYRARAVQAPWWRLTERLRRLPDGLVEDVLAEVAARGPICVADLEDRGAVEALDWSGWKGTGRATTMAVEVLWTRCRVVVCGRTSRGKIVDLPSRALPAAAAGHDPEPLTTLLVDRIRACGLMAEALGPWWGGLREARDQGLADALIRAGDAVRVRVSGSRRTYLAPPDLLDRTPADPDRRLRILGPLDPLLWDRKLVEHATGFRYVWEVYKPADQREWGWYVVPLLHRGRLVGRMEAHTDEAGAVVVDRLWEEVPRFPRRALDAAVARLERALRPAPIRDRPR